jgi:hypothetical protein
MHKAAIGPTTVDPKMRIGWSSRLADYVTVADVRDPIAVSACIRVRHCGGIRCSRKRIGGESYSAGRLRHPLRCSGSSRRSRVRAIRSRSRSSSLVGRVGEIVQQRERCIVAPHVAEVESRSCTRAAVVIATAVIVAGPIPATGVSGAGSRRRRGRAARSEGSPGWRPAVRGVLECVAALGCSCYVRCGVARSSALHRFVRWPGPAA